MGDEIHLIDVSSQPVAVRKSDRVSLAVDEGDRPQSIVEWRVKLEGESTEHEFVPVSQQGRHQSEKTIDDLPNHPPMENVQEMLLSVGLIDAARQLGVSVEKMDLIRKRYGLQLPKLNYKDERSQKSKAVEVLMLILLAIIAIIIGFALRFK